MNEIQGKNPGAKPHMIALVIIEAVIVMLMVLAAIYLSINIWFYKKYSTSINSKHNSSIDTECPTGQQGSGSGASYKIEGREKFNIDGTEVNLCCAISDNGTNQAKACSDETNNYTVIYTKINGQYVLTSQMYPKGEKRCIRNYKESGESAEICL